MVKRIYNSAKSNLKQRKLKYKNLIFNLDDIVGHIVVADDRLREDANIAQMTDAAHNMANVDLDVVLKRLCIASVDLLADLRDGLCDGLKFVGAHFAVAESSQVEHERHQVHD